MIDKTVKYDLCFSFGKGVRSVIYVKTNKNFKSLDDDSKSSPKKQVSIKKTDNKVDKTVKKPKECPEGKVLNPLTGRCINIKTIKKTDKKDDKKDDKKTDKTVKKTDKKKKECPEGKVLNPLTGRCIKIKAVKKDVKKTDKKKKECPEGKVLNPLTGRCIKIKK
jgi:sulfatase maturation enzyme AslB (radical SAM superfamily)